MAEWSSRQVDACWEAYTEALEELAASRASDVLAHPDLIKAAGHIPDAPDEWWDRMAEAAASSGMAAEVSSAGWRKPVGEQYPALPLLRRLVEHGVPLTTASDAHHLEHVADRADDLRDVLAAAGADTLQGYRSRAPHTVAVNPPAARSAATGVGRGGARGARRAHTGRTRPERYRSQARRARAPPAPLGLVERPGRPQLLGPAPPRAGPRQPRPPRRGGSRAHRSGTDAAEQPAHLGGAGPGGPKGQRVPVVAGGPLPALGRDRARHHPPPDHRRAGPGGEHPGALRGPHHRRSAAGQPGSAQGADLHVRAHLPRRVRAPGRHGGPVGLPLPRRGRRHRGGAPGGRRGRRGGCRGPGRVRQPQRAQRLPPHGHLRPARGAALRRPRHRGVGGRVGAGHRAAGGRGGRAPARCDRAGALHPAALTRCGGGGDDSAARCHRRPAPGPAAPLEGRGHPRGAPPGQEQPADHLVAAAPPGPAGGRPGRPHRPARGRAPGPLHRAGPRDPVARSERPGSLRRDRQLAGPDGRGLGGLLPAHRDRGARATWARWRPTWPRRWR